MAEGLVTRVADFVRRNHADIRQYLPDDIRFTVTGSGRELVGYSRAVYTGSGWTITIGHTVVPGALYEVRAVYQDDYVVWTGTSDGTGITEMSCVKRK